MPASLIGDVLFLRGLRRDGIAGHPEAAMIEPRPARYRKKSRGGVMDPV